MTVTPANLCKRGHEMLRLAAYLSSTMQLDDIVHFPYLISDNMNRCIVRLGLES